ncbi:MAG: hypothetical protein FD123_2993 [Bacteroidetes bacterium]|nr:MAG: hypothetical protein FD123_2993 [Bacteroidota bacterium]
MKRILVFFLLGLFIFNAVGVYGWFFFSLQQARQEMTLRMGFHAPVVLRVGLAEMAPGKGLFVRLKKHEILYKGHRYDIVSENKVGESVYFSGHRDDKEDAVYAMLDRHESGSGKNPMKGKRTITKLLEDYFAQDIFAENTFGEESFTLVYSTSRFNTLSSVLPVTAPPPELV